MQLGLLLAWTEKWCLKINEGIWCDLLSWKLFTELEVEEKANSTKFHLNYVLLVMVQHKLSWCKNVVSVTDLWLFSRLFYFEHNWNMHSRSEFLHFIALNPFCAVYFGPDDGRVVYTEVGCTSAPQITDATCRQRKQATTWSSACVSALPLSINLHDYRQPLRPRPPSPLPPIQPSVPRTYQ